MAKKLDYDQILTDVSAFIPDGIVDFTKPLHVQVLREALMELGYPEEFIHEYSENLSRVAVDIHEKKVTRATKQARDAGYVNVGGPYWAKKGRLDTVVAKSGPKGSTLIPMKPTSLKKLQAADKTKTPAKPTPKTKTPPKGDKTFKITKRTGGVDTRKKATAKAPKVPFSQKGEVTQGLFSSDYATTKVDGKDVKVRVLVDPVTKQSVDVSTPDGRKRGAEIVQQRLEKFGTTVKNASKLLSDKKLLVEFKQYLVKEYLKKNPDVKKVNIQKYLGEVGELATLGEFLALDCPTYLLPDSEPKNDILIQIETKTRGVKSIFNSVKSTKGGRELNELGANILSDLVAGIHQGTTDRMKVQVGDKVGEVDAGTFSASAIRANELAWYMFTGGRTGRDGIDISGLKPEQLAPGYKDAKDANGNPVLSKLEGKRVGFKDHSAYARYRVVTAKEVSEMVQSSRFDEVFQTAEGQRPSDEEGATLKAAFAEQLTKLASDPKNPLTLEKMNQWVDDQLANMIDQTGAQVLPMSDMAGYYYGPEGAEKPPVRIIPAEKMRQRLIETHGTKLNGKQQLELYAGIRHGSRGMDVSKSGGLVKQGKGYARPITNSSPTAKYADLGLDPREFVNYVRSL